MGYSSGRRSHRVAASGILPLAFALSLNVQAASKDGKKKESEAAVINSTTGVPLKDPRLFPPAGAAPHLDNSGTGLKNSRLLPPAIDHLSDAGMPAKTPVDPAVIDGGKPPDPHNIGYAQALLTTGGQVLKTPEVQVEQASQSRVPSAKKGADAVSEGDSVSPAAGAATYAAQGAGVQAAMPASEWEKGFELAKGAGDSKLASSFAARLGSAYDDLGDSSKSLKYYREVLRLAESGGSKRAQADVLGDMGQVCLKLADYKNAESFTSRALALHRETQDRGGEANDLNNLGLIHGYRGEYPKALEAYGKALELKRTLGDGAGEGAVLGNMGLAHEGLNDYAKALDFYGRALAGAENRGDKAAQLTALNQIAGVRVRLGDYSGALDGHEKALELARRTGGRQAEAAVTADMGVTYHYLGDTDKALDAYLRAGAIDRELGDRRALSFVLNNIAVIHSDLQDYPRAREYYAAAIKIGRAAGLAMKTEELNLGEAYLFEGNPKEAYPLFQKHQDHLYLGKYALWTADPKQAKREFSKTLEEAEKTRDADRLVAGSLGLGLALERRGDAAGAREAYAKAAAAMERQRELLPLSARGGFLTAKAEGFSRTEAYEGLARTAATPEEGFFWSENTKARVFVEGLSARLRDGASEAPLETARAEADLGARIAGLYKRMDSAFRDDDRKAYRELEGRLQETKKEQAGFVARLRREQPAYAAVQYPEPIKAGDVALKPDEVMVEYEVTEAKTLAFVLRPGKAPESLIIEIDRKELGELVRAFRKPFEKPLDGHGRFAGRFDGDAGARLHELLVKPILGLLPKDSKLIIVPDKALGAVPFDALTAAGGDDAKAARYLGDDHDVVYAQSATALSLARALRKGAGAKGGFLVLADPVFDDSDPRLRKGAGPKRRKPEPAADGYQAQLAAAVRRMGLEGSSFPRLKQTGELARAIKDEFGAEAKALVGTQASQARLLKEDLSSYRYLLFATHGILDADVPYIREPALVLSQAGKDSRQKGFLTMSQVMGLKLDAEVVALTACKTGLGKEVQGEGVMGLGRAFQYAGARNVLVSLWSVAEKSTTLMTERFFSHIQEGSSPRDALKAARADVRAAGYDHPFFWAPFALIGE